MKTFFASLTLATLTCAAPVQAVPVTIVEVCRARSPIGASIVGVIASGAGSAFVELVEADRAEEAVQRYTAFVVDEGTQVQITDHWAAQITDRWIAYHGVKVL